MFIYVFIRISEDTKSSKKKCWQATKTYNKLSIIVDLLSPCLYIHYNFPFHHIAPQPMLTLYTHTHNVLFVVNEPNIKSSKCPAAILYDTDTQQIQYWIGTAWWMCTGTHQQNPAKKRKWKRAIFGRKKNAWRTIYFVSGVCVLISMEFFALIFYRNAHTHTHADAHANQLTRFEYVSHSRNGRVKVYLYVFV